MVNGWYLPWYPLGIMPRTSPMVTEWSDILRSKCIHCNPVSAHQPIYFSLPTQTSLHMTSTRCLLILFTRYLSQKLTQSPAVLVRMHYCQPAQ